MNKDEMKIDFYKRIRELIAKGHDNTAIEEELADELFGDQGKVLAWTSEIRKELRR